MPKGEVAAGRARRRHTVLIYAKMHLAGPIRDRDNVCRKCGATCVVDFDLEPTAFCHTCAYDVLDMLAEAVVNAAKKRRRPR